MPEQQDPSHQSPLGVNSWLEDELYQEYLRDRSSVDESWKRTFETNGHAAPASGSPAAARSMNGAANLGTVTPPVPAFEAGPADHLVPLRGAAARIAENMTASLSMPVATSQRAIAVKVIDENRRILNEHRAAAGQSKVSYTHLIAYAIVKAVESVPALNHAYAESEGAGYRVVRDQVNIGLAIDVAGKGGSRSLVVPNVKGAQAMDFAHFVAAYDGLVARARANKLEPKDFEGTTLSLTNPGTVGTAGSIPRLMPGQGAIVATGAIDYPPEYRGVAEDVRLSMGLSKVMTMTCTYDHRVIQGAESGTFLGRIQALLEGEDGFYEKIFASLGVARVPAKWETSRETGPAETDPAKYAGIARLIDAYRSRGHLMAKLDPLGTIPEPHADLELSRYGLSIWDLDRRFGGETLRETVARYERIYCSTAGVEYMHLASPEERDWIRERFEARSEATPELKKRILRRLIEAEGFETFLHTRFVGHKRFSVEGGESAIVILDEMLDRAANTGVQEAVMGMAHRGRLTVLANLVGKSMVQLFGEFDGDIDPDSIEGSGDVKYHLGATGAFRSTEGREMTVSVAFNPSHLEAVDPVVEGLVRPKQDRLGDTKRERVIPILIHGDAAFIGQGVVPETLNLSQLEGYKTGGTLHLIINNQIGFTANPDEGRSSRYASDAALMIGIPVFHVNGDDPEACLRVARLAYEYRQQFKKDAVIDMICYRRHGHNEADDPSYTQPLLYRKIKEQKPIAGLYAARLEAEGTLAPGEADAMRRQVVERLNAVYDEAQRTKEQFELQELTSVPAGEVSAPRPQTAVERATLLEVVDKLTSFPADFRLHPKLKGFIDKRREALNGGTVDWAMAESLAFGTLVMEGTPVRLSGQDSGRGTFSQRHVEYSDFETGRRYIPMQHLAPGQAPFAVYDSPLSEYAVMGFEFGYSAADPLTLVLWEGQFGDFANGAQIVIDQFLAAAESKWGQPSGLVLLLPHGYEGQGPEHSSGRMERFLQLCSENNMQVCDCTTPAQYFHLLRRQMHGGKDRRGVRKPLIVFTPKSILRHPRVISPLDDLASGTFQEILAESTADPRAITKVLLCTGKIYYDLLAAREERRAGHVAIVRVEQLYPFAEEKFAAALAMYPPTAEVVWVQEEPQNMGAFRFINRYAPQALEAGGRQLHYAGRISTASPAAGSLKRHQYEQAKIIEDAFAPVTTIEKVRTRLVRRRKIR